MMIQHRNLGLSSMVWTTWTRGMRLWETRKLTVQHWRNIHRTDHYCLISNVERGFSPHYLASNMFHHSTALDERDLEEVPSVHDDQVWQASGPNPRSQEDLCWNSYLVVPWQNDFISKIIITIHDKWLKIEVHIPTFHSTPSSHWPLFSPQVRGFLAGTHRWGGQALWFL